MLCGDTGKERSRLLVTGPMVFPFFFFFFPNMSLLSGVWEKRCVVLGHFLIDPCFGLAGSQHPDLLHGTLQDG